MSDEYAVFKERQARETARAQMAVQQAVMISETNPQKALCLIVEELVEAHDYDMPPPYGIYPVNFFDCSLKLLEWVDTGTYLDVPITDEYDIATPELHEQLKKIRKAAGGWAFWRFGENEPVFIPDDQINKEIENAKAKTW
jgi:hypothetical protein